MIFSLRYFFENLIYLVCLVRGCCRFWDVLLYLYGHDIRPTISIRIRRIPRIKFNFYILYRVWEFLLVNVILAKHREISIPSQILLLKLWCLLTVIRTLLLVIHPFVHEWSGVYVWIEGKRVPLVFKSLRCRAVVHSSFYNWFCIWEWRTLLLFDSVGILDDKFMLVFFDFLRQLFRSSLSHNCFWFSLGCTCRKLVWVAKVCCIIIISNIKRKESGSPASLWKILNRLHIHSSTHASTFSVDKFIFQNPMLLCASQCRRLLWNRHRNFKLLEFLRLLHHLLVLWVYLHWSVVDFVPLAFIFFAFSYLWIHFCFVKSRRYNLLFFWYRVVVICCTILFWRGFISWKFTSDVHIFQISKCSLLPTNCLCCSLRLPL